MPGSDNTSYGRHRPSKGILGRFSARLGLSPKQITYLEDLGGGLALAIVLWTLYVLVAVLMP